MAEPFRVSINPELLIWARETSGFSPDEIASSVGVKPEVLASWENGEAAPTWRQLKAIANKTKRPLAAFYLPSAPEKTKKPHDYRTFEGIEPGQFSPALLGWIREARSLRNRVEELLEEAEVPAFESLPRFTIRNEPRECSRMLREFLGVSLGDQINWKDQYTALGAWREILFEKGVLVVQLPIAESEARGFSEYHDRISLVAVSSKEEPYPRIFTIFHEVAHLCVGHTGVSDPRLDIPVRGAHSYIERFCNRVAAEFLVPIENRLVHDQLCKVAPSGVVDLGALRKASTDLKVSQSALLYRMVEANLITDAEYAGVLGVWRQRKRGIHKTPAKIPVPVRRIASVGRSYAALVFDALDRGRISTHEACVSLGLRTRWLEDARLRTYSGAINV